MLTNVNPELKTRAYDDANDDDANDEDNNDEYKQW